MSLLQHAVAGVEARIMAANVIRSGERYVETSAGSVEYTTRQAAAARCRENNAPPERAYRRESCQHGHAPAAASGGGGRLHMNARIKRCDRCVVFTYRNTTSGSRAWRGHGE